MKAWTMTTSPMKLFSNILVATDTRLNAHPVIDEAAELARLNGASLKLVDVVPEFSWATRMVVSDHEEIRRLMGQEKQDKLEALAAPLREQGLSINVRVLWGKTSVEIIREVLRGRHDLVMRVAKGHVSQHKGFYGATGRRLLRECPCAVWLVAAAESPAYKHVVACVDTASSHKLDEELNNKVYELASSLSQQHKARFTLLHAWHLDTETLLSHRMSRINVEKMWIERSESIEGHLDKFLQTRGTGARPDNVELIKLDPSFAIPAYTKEHNADLVVMGTVARSGLAGMVIGNTAERILDNLECSVLAVKPDSFVSRITESEYINLAAETGNV